jgi:hypothetical protein
MFYATITVCMMGVIPCSVEQAMYAEQSAPVWTTMEECFSEVALHVKQIDLSTMRGFVEGAGYDIHISCDHTVP